MRLKFYTLVLTVFLIFLSACSEPPEPARTAFQLDQENLPATDPVITSSFSIYSKESRLMWTLRDALNVGIAEEGIVVEPRLPISLFMQPLIIRNEDILGCTMRCFGTKPGDDWEVVLLVSRNGHRYTVDFERAKEIKAWCWEKKIPMISGKHQRQWQYKGEELPEKRNYLEQLANKDIYDVASRSACAGY